MFSIPLLKVVRGMKLPLNSTPFMSHLMLSLHIGSANVTLPSVIFAAANFSLFPGLVWEIQLLDVVAKTKEFPVINLSFINLSHHSRIEKEKERKLFPLSLKTKVYLFSVYALLWSTDYTAFLIGGKWGKMGCLGFAQSYWIPSSYIWVWFYLELFSFRF